MSESRRPFLQGDRRRRNPLVRLLDLFSNIWLGVLLVALIFVYCSVGSAMPDPVEALRHGSYNVPHLLRQRFELTEMEWFSWWPFLTLVGLLVAALVTVTLRRIPFRPVNYGVWMIHAGMVTLAVGCVIYFSQKVEGDVAVYRRSAVIRVPGTEEPVHMTVRPGEAVTAGRGEHVYHIQVAEVNPNYRLLGGEHEGQNTYAVYLDVRSPKERFTRQLLAGFPAKTEDFRPGQGRTKGLIDTDLQIELDYAPVDEFYIEHSAAIYVRRVGDRQWTQLPIPKLPRYYEHVSSRSWVWPDAHADPPPLRPLDIHLSPQEPSGGCPRGLSVTVSGFLPFATPEQRWAPGGERLNPVLGLSIEAGGREHHFDLLALNPARSVLDTSAFPVHFAWVSGPEEIAQLSSDKNPRLAVRVPDRGVDLEATLAELQSAKQYQVPGTDYVLRFLQAMPWTMASDAHRGERAFVALLEVQSADTSFTRAVVYPHAEMTQDIDASGVRHGELLDEGIELTLIDPAVAGLTLAAGLQEVGLHAIYRRDDGSVSTTRPAVGEPFMVTDQALPMTVEYVYPRAVQQTKPRIIPTEQRDTKAGAAYSMVRLDLSQKQWSESAWLTYSHYTHPGRQPYEPGRVRLPDGTQLELLYSRQKRPLPAPVALEEFQLKTYPGGTRERDYVSLVRFGEAGAWSDAHEVRSNQPTAYKGLWFFQSTWDPPDSSANYGGMNYTGLGVGNREGVRIMLGGTVLAIIGMIYAFYVKPIIKRRRRLAVLGSLGAKRTPAPEAEVREPVGV